MITTNSDAATSSRTSHEIIFENILELTFFVSIFLVSEKVTESLNRGSNLKIEKAFLRK